MMLRARAELTTHLTSYSDHEGVYMHTQIGASLGHCPATVGQD